MTYVFVYHSLFWFLNDVEVLDDSHFRNRFRPAYITLTLHTTKFSLRRDKCSPRYVSWLTSRDVIDIMHAYVLDNVTMCEERFHCDSKQYNLNENINSSRVICCFVWNGIIWELLNLHLDSTYLCWERYFESSAFS